MTRYTLTVPLQFSDGDPVAATWLDGIAADIANIAGGYTAHDGIGGWIGRDGNLVTEPVRIFTVDNAYDIFGALHSYAQHLAGMLDQDAIYLTTLGSLGFKTWLVTREPVTA